VPQLGRDPHSRGARVADELLIRRWQASRDPGARRELMERNEALVRSLAARFTPWGEPFDDLLQVAWIGMLKALDRFDPDRGLAFATYAAPTIVGEIRRHFRDRTWAVHVPRSIQDLRPTVNRAIAQLSADHGRSPSVREVAERTGVSEEDVLEVIHSERARTAASLSMPMGDRDDTSFEVADEERGYAHAEATVLLGAAVAALDERDRQILVLRFVHGLSQSQIAAEVGISQMHVSRLLRRSFSRLREGLGEVDEVV
jgi:RNA polymerase sigma-B factor